MSLMTCQRIAGSESSSHSINGLSVLKASRFGSFIAFLPLDHQALLVTASALQSQPFLQLRGAVARYLELGAFGIFEPH